MERLLLLDHHGVLRHGSATAYQAWTLATLVLGISSIVWIVVLRNAVGVVF